MYSTKEKMLNDKQRKRYCNECSYSQIKITRNRVRVTWKIQSEQWVEYN